MEYDIWYDSVNPRSLALISDMRSFNQRLGTHALMTPHVIIWKCASCSPEEIQRNCIVYPDVTYCSPPMQNTNVTGKDILRAGLIEKCIYKVHSTENNAEKWWSYMDYLYKNCNGGLYNTECSNKALLASAIDIPKVSQCKLKEKEHFDEERGDLEYWKIPYIPAVVINNRTYRVYYHSNCVGFFRCKACFPEYLCWI